jgi:hypothetical protein
MSRRKSGRITQSSNSLTRRKRNMLNRTYASSVIRRDTPQRTARAREPFTRSSRRRRPRYPSSPPTTNPKEREKRLPRSKKTISTKMRRIFLKATRYLEASCLQYA